MITFCACTRRVMLCSTASDSFLRFHSFHSVLVSFALPVETWNRLTDKNISIRFLLFAAAVAVFIVVQLTKMHFCFLGCISERTCYCPLSNKYISCYLFINMDGCFSSNKFLICCYISCTFCFVFVPLFLWSSRQSFLDIYLYQTRETSSKMKYLTTN